MGNSDSRPCPACKSVKGTEKGDKNDHRVVVCAVCHTIYTTTDSTVAPEESYGEYYTAANLEVPEFITARAAEIIRGFDALRKNNRMLDIGFGSGGLLEAARDQGWNAHGIEVSLPAVEHARDKGFEVFHGTLEEARYPDDHFDLITASEILEHLPDPQSSLKEIARILRPGGMLWATTPSSKSLSFRLMGIDWSMVAPPEHSQLFSAKAVKKMLRDAGFSHVEVKTHGLRPGELLEYYKKKKRTAAKDQPGPDSLCQAYQLNESLTRTPLRRFIKSSLNATLNAFGMGDSLKIFARL